VSVINVIRSETRFLDCLRILGTRKASVSRVSDSICCSHMAVITYFVSTCARWISDGPKNLGFREALREGGLIWLGRYQCTSRRAVLRVREIRIVF
jgi:hypothetical protein